MPVLSLLLFSLDYAKEDSSFPDYKIPFVRLNEIDMDVSSGSSGNVNNSVFVVAAG